MISIRDDNLNMGGHNNGGSNRYKGGYFFHTLEGIDVGLDKDMFIIQEMHDAENGKIVRQSIGIDMGCAFQITTYQNRDERGRFRKKIEFFGYNWRN